MMRLIVTTTLILLFAASANADIWKYADSTGITHFVDSDKPIFTWTDDAGQHYYSNKPESESAVSVELVWVSAGSLPDANSSQMASSGSSQTSDDEFAYAGETAAERESRKQAEAYYCKRATEVYESYANAPRLYKTGADGNKAYLSEEEANQTMAETESRVDELCR